MTIAWTRLALPSGKTYADELYNFLTTFEAQTPEERQKPQLVNGDITIGVGFDLKAGGTTVQNAVFEKMGFSAKVVGATNNSNLTAAEKEDYKYVQLLRQAIEEGGEAGKTKLNSVMAARAKYYGDSSKTDPAYVSHINWYCS